MYLSVFSGHLKMLLTTVSASKKTDSTPETPLWCHFPWLYLTRANFFSSKEGNWQEDSLLIH